MAYSAIAREWFEHRGFAPFDFQKAVWRAMAKDKSGLLHATTGAGKTYAVWLGALARFASKGADKRKAPLTVLWITPMRALAADSARALAEPLEALGLDFSVGVRTGDTSLAERARQNRRMPSTLITTPESLSLMLARNDAGDLLRSVRLVVVDEWHELIGNKRGVQVQLALARLALIEPQLMVWGLSATLGNLKRASEALLGGREGVLIEGQIEKDLIVDTLLPDTMERFPWGGHLGIRMLMPVVKEIEAARTTLVFLNTRSQAEIWFQSILQARPDWAGILALHHGSLAKEVRDWVEISLKEGKLKAVVCTSSLDLGVDFLPVERVLQIGSAKGIARLLQRAGRSGHAPGRASRVTLVPTTAIELIEAAAAKDAVATRRVEPREPPDKPLDVLVQHLVTIALGAGFVAADLLREVRMAYSYRALTIEEWSWALDFVTRGGPSLIAYPEYRRVVADETGVYRVPDASIAKRHRMSVGTIVADASVNIQFVSGKRIGTVEESFIARLRPGDHFLFAGRLLELVRVHEMTAYVRRGQGKKASVPRWNGGKMPLSSELANAVLTRLAAARQGVFDGPEMTKVKPLIELQMRYSDVPTPAQWVIERLVSKEGHHLFVYPIAGRPVHIGLASLLAYRVARHAPATFSMSVNDYGFELLAADEIDWSALFDKSLLASDHLLEDTVASLNASELAKRRFREIARISGLVFQGFPGAPRSMKQLQASSSLFFEVFRKHDEGNLLLGQAEREVLEQELELGRLTATLDNLRMRELVIKHVERPTPFAFPLLVERFRETVSTERLPDRIARMVAQLEALANAP
jgi:ATP-dependent Lhr-like helicase